tara:strand:+ start:21531 stop:22292 length:762 start_codon:yes stop_codon:yes gene_type:complete
MNEIKSFYNRQNLTYKGELNSISKSITTINSRILKEVFLWTYFLELFELIPNNKNKIDYIERDIEVLEAGCGCGTISKYLAPFAKKVFAFDNSDEGIKISKRLNNDFDNIFHFCADGLDVSSITEIKGKKFDFILLREFHPLSRKVFYGKDHMKYFNLIDSYYKLLKPSGILIVSHVPRGGLRFKDLPKNYKRNFIGTYVPNFLIISLLLFRYSFKIASPLSSLMTKLIYKVNKNQYLLSILRAPKKTEKKIK